MKSLLFANAIIAAGQSLETPDKAIPNGTRVKVVDNQDCFGGETGVVIGRCTSLLGAPLVDVKLDSGTETSFYPYELVPEKE